MEAPVCPVCTPYEAQADRCIARTHLFKAILDWRDQRTPGRLIIATEEHIPALRDWTGDHWSEFGLFERSLERALHKGLDPTEPHKLINLECKMNLSSADATHTHWHMLPRYRNPITLADPETGEKLTFEDSFYGRPYNFDQATYRPVSPALMARIIRSIQESLDLTGISGGQVGQ